MSISRHHIKRQEDSEAQQIIDMAAASPSCHLQKQSTQMGAGKTANILPANLESFPDGDDDMDENDMGEYGNYSAGAA